MSDEMRAMYDQSVRGLRERALRKLAMPGLMKPTVKGFGSDMSVAEIDAKVADLRAQIKSSEGEIADLTDQITAALVAGKANAKLEPKRERLLTRVRDLQLAVDRLTVDRVAAEKRETLVDYEAVLAALPDLLKKQGASHQAALRALRSHRQAVLETGEALNSIGRLKKRVAGVYGRDKAQELADDATLELQRAQFETVRLSVPDTLIDVEPEAI